MANESTAGFWFVRGSPSTEDRMKEHDVDGSGKRLCLLTKEPLRAKHLHDIWHWIVEERHPHGVAHRQLPILLRQQGAVVEGAHGIEPGLGGAVNETAINPSSHLIYLRSRLYCDIVQTTSPAPTCSLGAFGLCPVLRS